MFNWRNYILGEISLLHYISVKIQVLAFKKSLVKLEVNVMQIFSMIWKAGGNFNEKQ